MIKEVSSTHPCLSENFHFDRFCICMQGTSDVKVPAAIQPVYLAGGGYNYKFI